MQGVCIHASGGVEHERKAESCDWPYQVSGLTLPCNLYIVTASLVPYRQQWHSSPCGQHPKDHHLCHDDCHDVPVMCLSLDGGVFAFNRCSLHSTAGLPLLQAPTGVSADQCCVTTPCG